MKWVSPRVIRGNRGDLLSRWGVLSALHALGARDVAVLCTRERHVPPTARGALGDYGPLYNFIPTARGRALLHGADAVVWTGGLDLQDDSSLLKLVHTLLVFASYRLAGLRILAAMQGAGPLETRSGRLLARMILDRIGVFLVRDAGSMRLLERLGSRTRLIRCYDGIFLPGFPGESLDASETARVDALVGDAHGRPVVGVNVRLWFHFARSVIPYQFAKARYLRRAEARMTTLVDRVADLVRMLRERRNARVLLVSMYEPGVEPWEDDLPLLERIRDRFGGDRDVVLADDDLSLPAFHALMTRLDLMVGTRLHSTLAAIRAGAPAIHLSYTLKGRDIFTDLGLSDLVFDLEPFMADPSAVVRRALTALDEPGLRDRIAQTRDGAIEANMTALADALREMEAA